MTGVSHSIFIRIGNRVINLAQVVDARYFTEDEADDGKGPALRLNLAVMNAKAVANEDPKRTHLVQSFLRGREAVIVWAALEGMSVSLQDSDLQDAADDAVDRTN